MIRALGKEHDWDMTRMAESKYKPRDNAQRWRMFRNIARFYKNPFGYVFWKAYATSAGNRIRGFYVIAAWNCVMTFFSYLHMKNTKEELINKWRFAVGEMDQFHMPSHDSVRYPSERKKNYIRYSNFHQKNQNKRVSSIMLNFWCRD